MKLKNKTIAIIGGGNLGMAIAQGLSAAGLLQHNKLIITRRRWPQSAVSPRLQGQVTHTTDNRQAVATADIVLLCVQPQQLVDVLAGVGQELSGKTIVSTLTGVTLAQLHAQIPGAGLMVRAMPNTALAVRMSMTCLSSRAGRAQLAAIEEIFAALGKTIVIDDDLMQAATVLAASGIAFWLRLIRATTQGGIQLGFDAPEAQQIAVQTCLGAASLLQDNNGSHPEPEIDKVTTPRGCTIEGLNEMEHQGLSSALIKGLVASYKKINEI